MKRILCFGDSNTWGLIASAHDRYDSMTRWTGRLQMACPDAQIIEEGLCGRTTQWEDATRPGRSGTALLPVLLESHAPLDLVIVMLGTNDCKTAYYADTATICRGVETLLGQIRRIQPQAEILLAAPIEMGDDVQRYDPEMDRTSATLSRTLGPAYRALAAKWGTGFLNAADAASPSPVDCEHLDAAGHAALADAMAQAVKGIFLEKAV